MQTLMRSLSDVRLAFGQSDEYSFVLHKSTQLYGEGLVMEGSKGLDGRPAQASISCSIHTVALHSASVAFKQKGGGLSSADLSVLSNAASQLLFRC